jgi:hypothetical protein
VKGPAVSYPLDPGGVFASDVHRRVQANVPNPGDDPLTIEELLAQRIAKDEYLDIDESELIEVLEDLEANGHSKQLKDGWKNTPAGFAALTGPPAED